MLRITLILFILFPNALRVQAQGGKTMYEELAVSSRKSIPYAVHLPDGFDASRTYPVLIGPGEGVRGEEPGFYWASDPYSHGWIIVDARIWEKATRDEIERLLDQVSSDYNVEGGKFHTACWSANSAGIFDLVIDHADRFHSITGMAGNPRSLSKRDIEALQDVRVQFVVGDRDGYWMRSAKDAYEQLMQGGVTATLEIIPNGEHVMRNLIGRGFMQRMDRLR